MKWDPADLEAVACDFCNGTASREVITRPDGLRAVQCTTCGLCFISPRPKSGLIARLYDQDYFGHAGIPECGKVGYGRYADEAEIPSLKNQAQLRLSVVSQFAELKGSTCLEVGCATGEYCEELRNAGSVATGIDISNYAVKLASERYRGISFRNCGIEDLQDIEQFDYICAFEVIEHVLSPGHFLSMISRHLRPNGLAFITTPNRDCGQRVGESLWTGFSRSFEHLYFLAAGSLRNYAGKCGLVEVAALTGLGDGIAREGIPEDDAAASRRSMVRALIANLGLSRIARKIRDTVLQRRYGPYVLGGSQHNLFFIMRRTK